MRSYQDAWFWADSTSRISIVSQYHIQIYLRNFRDNMAQPSCRKPWSLGWPNQSRRSRKNTNSHNMCCYPTRSPQTICKTLCDILLCLCWWNHHFSTWGWISKPIIFTSKKSLRFFGKGACLQRLHLLPQRIQHRRAQANHLAVSF